ncbi:MAG: 50S ribosomal protein L25, large subunit ribosomal protein L25 [Candidatus Peregrinibacteria bacterium GW2011_GWF2_43_17]|nr:MAG: 50S ribosomal protein L25, large subunit ribosomal protein L25 [Candidatus Peregrinibacteria bacterium GW2011_GWF2_43_17]HAU40233.1 50S ribosomal protein L25 [Candidatus Peregrinibacteria bacterium]
MDTYKLELSLRDLKKKVRNLRKQELIPCVIYGKGIDSLAMQVEYQPFRKVYRKAGGNNIIDLKVGDKEYKALVHHVDFDPVTDKIAHIDFINVRMDREITAQVPLEFFGISLAVKDLGGTIVHSRDRLTVRCLPAKLPGKIEVDITPIVDFRTVVTVKDIKLPEGVVVLEKQEQAIASAVAPRAEEEEIKPAVGVDVNAEGVPIEKVEEGAPAVAGAEEGKKEEVKKKE